MAENLINEIDSGETPGVEGQTEGGFEAETGEDVLAGIASASGNEVAGAVRTGLKGEDVSDWSEPTATGLVAEGGVLSGAEDTELDIDASPPDAAIEANRCREKRWGLHVYKTVIAGLVLGLCMSPLVAYGLKHWHMHRGEQPQDVAFTRVYRAPATTDWDAILDLAAFVVLLPEGDDRAYFSLRLSVKLSNIHAYMEIY